MSKHTWVKWFIAYMLIAGGNYMVYSMWLPLRIAHHVILSVILLFWFLKYGLPNTHLLWPVGAVGVSVALSVVGAQDKRMALEYAWVWWINSALLLICSSWYQQGRARELLGSMFISGAFLAATCILDFALYGGRPGGVFFNINLAGGFIAALIAPSMARARATGSLKYYLLMGLFCLVVALNQSRGALLCVAVSVAALMLLRGDIRLKRLSWVLPLGAAGLILLGWANHNAGDAIRMDLWRVAQQLIETKPLGVGAGLFAQAYQSAGAGGDFRFTGAHNYYLTLGAELGAPGLAAGSVFILLIMYGVAGQKRTLEQDGSLAALVGVAAHMLVDNFPSQNYTFLCSLLLAHLLSSWAPFFSIPTRLKYLMSAGVMLGAALMLRFDRAQIVYERSLSSGSYSLAQQALELDPENRLYQINYTRAAHDGNLTPALAIDPNILKSDSLMLYGLSNYGRVFR